MKRLTISLFVCTVLFLSTTVKVNAQMKIGCLNTNELIAAMPENDSAQAVIDARTNEFVAQSQDLQAQYQKKYQEFLTQGDSLSPLIRQTKQAELQDMGRNIETFNAAADQELVKLRQEIYNPIIEKAQNAIKEVAKEGGFTYILDLATNCAVFFPEEGPLNVMEAVKAKLGLI